MLMWLSCSNISARQLVQRTVQSARHRAMQAQARGEFRHSVTAKTRSHGLWMPRSPVWCHTSLQTPSGRPCSQRHSGIPRDQRTRLSEVMTPDRGLVRSQPAHVCRLHLCEPRTVDAAGQSAVPSLAGVSKSPHHVAQASPRVMDIGA